MNESQKPFARPADDDDVEGHFRRQGRADSESAEDDDVEGHFRRQGRADSESAEDDDVEGHVYVQEPKDRG